MRVSAVGNRHFTAASVRPPRIVAPFASRTGVVPPPGGLAPANLSTTPFLPLLVLASFTLVLPGPEKAADELPARGTTPECASVDRVLARVTWRRREELALEGHEHPARTPGTSPGAGNDRTQAILSLSRRIASNPAFGRLVVTSRDPLKVGVAARGHR
jgi:hypothetical protein